MIRFILSAENLEQLKLPWKEAILTGCLQEDDPKKKHCVMFGFRKKHAVSAVFRIMKTDNNLTFLWARRFFNLTFIGNILPQNTLTNGITYLLSKPCL